MILTAIRTSHLHISAKINSICDKYFELVSRQMSVKGVTVHWYTVIMYLVQCILNIGISHWHQTEISVIARRAVTCCGICTVMFRNINKTSYKQRRADLERQKPYGQQQHQHRDCHLPLAYLFGVTIIVVCLEVRSQRQDVAAVTTRTARSLHQPQYMNEVFGYKVVLFQKKNHSCSNTHIQ